MAPRLLFVLALPLASLPAIANSEVSSAIDTDDTSLLQLNVALPVRAHQAVLDTATPQSPEVSNELILKDTLLMALARQRDAGSDAVSELRDFQDAIRQHVINSEVSNGPGTVNGSDVPFDGADHLVAGNQQVPDISRVHMPSLDGSSTSSAGGPGKKSLVVRWHISDIEDGTEVNVSLGSSCRAFANATVDSTGRCSLSPNLANNPPKLDFGVANPLGNDTHFQMTVSATAFMLDFHMKADCLLCGGSCTVDLPFGQDVTLNMPACPLPQAGVQMSMAMLGSLDLSNIPAVLSFKAKVMVKLLRGNGDKVGKVSLELELK